MNDPPPLVVLPFHDRRELVEPLPGGRYRVRLIFPGGPPARLLHLQGGHYAHVSASGRSLRLLRWDGADMEVVRRQTLPRLGEIEAVALCGDRLYVAGRIPRGPAGDREHQLGFVSLGLPDGEEELVLLPEEAQGPGKGIDALVADPGRLVVIDDIVVPKYFVVYETDTRGVKKEPRIEVFSIGLNGRVEHVALGPRHFALCGSTGLRAGGERLVGLYDRRTLAPVGSVSLFAPSGGGRGLGWYGSALRDDRLYIAGGEEGVGTVDLRSRWLTPEDLTPRLRFRAVSAGSVVAVSAAPGGCYAMAEQEGRRQVFWVRDL